jgi:hypothetical protein
MHSRFSKIFQVLNPLKCTCNGLIVGAKSGKGIVVMTISRGNDGMKVVETCW